MVSPGRKRSRPGLSFSTQRAKIARRRPRYAGDSEFGKRTCKPKRKRAQMPIRKRGNSWQIDIRTAEGTRIRKTYATKEEATEAEAALRPNPQQRAAMRKVRRESRRSSARLLTMPDSSKPSSVTPDIANQTILQRLSWLASRKTSPNSIPTTEPASTANSEASLPASDAETASWEYRELKGLSHEK